MTKKEKRELDRLVSLILVYSKNIVWEWSEGAKFNDDLASLVYYCDEFKRKFIDDQGK